MITYNQELYIADAIESLLNQGILPSEITISDDFSTDKTREILDDYAKRYPGLITLHFQKENLGIYKNLNYITYDTKIRGDTVSYLAGDDLYKDGIFSAINNVINNKKIDLNSEFMVLSNFTQIDVNGSEVLKSNNLKYKNRDPVGAKIRNLIGSRYTGISRKLLLQVERWDETIGIWADYQHAVELFLRCKNFYYINDAYPVYRLGVGVSSKTKQNEIDSSYIRACLSISKKFKNNLTSADIKYLEKEVVSANIRLRIYQSLPRVLSANVAVLHDVFLGYLHLRLWIKNFIRDLVVLTKNKFLTQKN